MKLVIFGLTVSSSWGNGHATLWRGLIRELTRKGHNVVFFEKDMPYYAMHRDMTAIEGGELILYSEFVTVMKAAVRHLNGADVGMVTSFCPDGPLAGDVMLTSSVRTRIFYDMDTPVTLRQLGDGNGVPYLRPEGLGDFDLVLSFTGGAALTRLISQLGAKRVAALYGSVDPDVHRPTPKKNAYACDLSYLGAYSQDRQEALERLFFASARRLPKRKFLVGGSLHPSAQQWPKNTIHREHVPPPEHSAFYSSSRLTLNVTRGPMAEIGYCPSVRLFEAAACGTPLITDVWEGLDEFFSPGIEIIPATTTEDVVNAMQLSDAELGRFSQAARERVLDSHTARRRAAQLEQLLTSFVGNRAAA